MHKENVNISCGGHIGNGTAPNSLYGLTSLKQSLAYDYMANIFFNIECISKHCICTYIYGERTKF